MIARLDPEGCKLVRVPLEELRLAAVPVSPGAENEIGPELDGSTAATDVPVLAEDVGPDV